LILNKKEKEKLVIELAHQGKTTREIAKQVRISLRAIGQILNRVTGDDAANEEAEKQSRLKKLSPYAQALGMFRDKRDLADVSIELDLKTDTVISYFGDYLRLLRMESLFNIYKELRDDLPLFLHLFRRIKKEGLNKHDIKGLIETQHLLSDLGKKVDLYNSHIWDLHAQKLKLEKEVGTLSEALR
jgi:transposase